MTLDKAFKNVKIILLSLLNKTLNQNLMKVIVAFQDILQSVSTTLSLDLSQEVFITCTIYS